jgi:hypothetical protein
MTGYDRDDIAHMQRADRERFFDVAGRCQNMIDRAVAVDGEAARESAQRVAANTLRAIFSRPGDDEPGARLRRNKPAQNQGGSPLPTTPDAADGSSAQMTSPPQTA